MHLVEIKFDRVFDIVQASERKYSRYTQFGFESNGRKFYSVHIEGGPEIIDGMRVLAALERRDDWQSLIGWRNLETNEINIPSASKQAIYFLGCLSFAAIVALTSEKYESNWILLVCIPFIYASYCSVHWIVLIRRAKAALKDAAIIGRQI